jgi:hypothetical protein
MDTQLGAPRSSPRAQSELTKPTSSLVSSRQGIKPKWKHLHARHAGGRGVDGVKRREKEQFWASVAQTRPNGVFGCPPSRKQDPPIQRVQSQRVFVQQLGPVSAVVGRLRKGPEERPVGWKAR